MVAAKQASQLRFVEKINNDNAICARKILKFLTYIRIKKHPTINFFRQARRMLTFALENIFAENQHKEIIHHFEFHHPKSCELPFEAYLALFFGPATAIIDYNQIIQTWFFQRFYHG